MGGDISKPHGGEGDHAEVERVEQGQVVARSFKVLDTADTDRGQHQRMEKEQEEVSVPERDFKC